jgi:hypothetical protein
MKANTVHSWRFEDILDIALQHHLGGVFSLGFY